MLITYLAVLVALPVIYQKNPGIQEVFPNPMGPVPLDVLWWGALGGYAWSLTGISTHARDWDPALALWHVFRPLLGAIFAAVAFLAYNAIVQLSNGQAAANPILYDVLAFVVGYREQAFRDLIGRVSDLLINPASPNTASQRQPTQPNGQAGDRE